MRFDFAIGNPPYQGDNHQQLYPDIYLAGRELADNVDMIFPTGWQEPKKANNLSKLNNKEIKADSQIIKIDNIQGAFPHVAGAEWTNIIIWKRGYDNGLNGKQLIYTNDADPEVRQLAWNKADIQKPDELVTLAKLVMENPEFVSMQNITSVLKPYGLRTDAFAPKDKAGKLVSIREKYGLPELQKVKLHEDDIMIYGAKSSYRYAPSTYPFPKKGAALYKYKVFVPYAWGNMSASSNYLGGAYSDIILAKPKEACNEAYQESGCFDAATIAQCHAKYLFTKFCRALLFVNKNSQHSTTAWGAVPVQDYSEKWWKENINLIDEHLFAKYNVPENIWQFVRDNIQPRTVNNIVNYKETK